MPKAHRGQGTNFCLVLRTYWLILHLMAIYTRKAGDISPRKVSSWHSYRALSSGRGKRSSALWRLSYLCEVVAVYALMQVMFGSQQLLAQDAGPRQRQIFGVRWTRERYIYFTTVLNRRFRLSTRKEQLSKKRRVWQSSLKFELWRWEYASRWGWDWIFSNVRSTCGKSFTTTDDEF